MGKHALAMPVNTSDAEEMARLLLRALTSFRQGDSIIANGYVGLAEAHCEQTEQSTADFGRLLLELAYEMARCGLDDTLIEPILRRADRVMTTCPTGNMEVTVMTGRINLFRGNPVEALRMYLRITSLLDDRGGIGRGVVSPKFLSYFDKCNHLARVAMDEQDAKWTEYLETNWRLS